MTHSPHHHERGEDDTRTGQDVSAGLRAALRERPAPPPTWDMATIKARGRRRRARARAVPIAAGLLLFAGVGAVAATSEWPWNTTTTVATSGVDAEGNDPDQVVRGYLSARQAGDNARAFRDYWTPDVGSRLDVTTEPLLVDHVDIGPTQTAPTGAAARVQGWQQAVTVTVTLHWDNGPGLSTGKAPSPAQLVLVRHGDDQPWRIFSSFDFPGYSVPSIPAPPSTGEATTG
ncbi:hypothetical protein AB1207_22125 [Kineococcus endophyticus]|uniref:DUF4829 domain-containing protein n=1 Tax=Kineococcus endophyticus TaxID=1181883 RepID=A0ABV3PDC5_9ACTN